MCIDQQPASLRRPPAGTPRRLVQGATPGHVRELEDTLFLAERPGEWPEDLTTSRRPCSVLCDGTRLFTARAPRLAPTASIEVTYTRAPTTWLDVSVAVYHRRGFVPAHVAAYRAQRAASGEDVASDAEYEYSHEIVAPGTLGDAIVTAETSEHGSVRKQTVALRTDALPESARVVVVALCPYEQAPICADIRVAIRPSATMCLEIPSAQAARNFPGYVLALYVRPAQGVWEQHVGPFVSGSPTHRFAGTGRKGRELARETLGPLIDRAIG